MLIGRFLNHMSNGLNIEKNKATYSLDLEMQER